MGTPMKSCTRALLEISGAADTGLLISMGSLSMMNLLRFGSFAASHSPASFALNVLNDESPHMIVRFRVDLMILLMFAMSSESGRSVTSFLCLRIASFLRRGTAVDGRSGRATTSRICLRAEVRVALRSDFLFICGFTAVLGRGDSQNGLTSESRSIIWFVSCTGFGSSR